MIDKKRGNLFLIFGVVLILSVSLVSAGLFSDFWGKITGKATTGTCSGTATSCSSFTTLDTCASQAGCVFGSAAFSSPCGGTATSCSSMTSESSCNAQAGCLWTTATITPEEIINGEIVSFTTDKIFYIVGETATFSIGVKNTGNTALAGLGPASGTVYSQSQDFNSLGYPASTNTGRTRVAVGQGYPDYPWRWNTGNLAPGTGAIITGKVKWETAGNYTLCAGLVNEWIAWLDKDKFCKTIIVSPLATPGCDEGYICLDSDNPKIIVTFSGVSYEVELLFASDTAATIEVTTTGGQGISKEVSEGQTKEINGLYIYVKSTDETNLKFSVVLEAGSNCEMGYTCLDYYNTYTKLSLNNKNYGVELLSASDTSAIIKVEELRSDGRVLSNVIKEVSEGTTKVINGLNVYLKSADETPDYFRVILQISSAEQPVTCTDSDGVTETKEIIEGGWKEITGLQIAVENADETNLKLSADLDISYLYDHVTDIDLTSDNPTKEVSIDGINYIIELISASDTSATIKVNSGKNYYVKGAVYGYDLSTESYVNVTDNCETETGLNEYICDGIYGVETEYLCPNGCVEGACFSYVYENTIDGCNLISEEKQKEINDYLSELEEGYILSNAENIQIQIGTYVILAGNNGRGYLLKLKEIDYQNKESIFENILTGELINAQSTLNLDLDYNIDYETFEGKALQLNHPQTTGSEILSFKKCFPKLVEGEISNLIIGGTITLGNNRLLQLVRVYNDSGEDFTNDLIIFKDTLTSENYQVIFISEGEGTLVVDGKEYIITFTGTGENVLVQVKLSKIASKTIEECENGCILDEKCYQYNSRKEGRYCDISKTWLQQLADEKDCVNNFECKSNVCVSGQCIESSLIEKILGWLKEVFS